MGSHPLPLGLIPNMSGVLTQVQVSKHFKGPQKYSQYFCANVCLCVCTHIFTYSFYLFPLFFLIHKLKEKTRWCDHHAERTRWVALMSSLSHSGMRLKASYKSHQASQPVLHLVDLLWSLWLALCCLGLASDFFLPKLPLDHVLGSC